MYSDSRIKSFVFVWAGGEYLWIMKINFVGRVGLEMVAEAHDRNFLVRFNNRVFFFKRR